MATKTQKKTVKDVIVWETDNRYTREEVTFLNNTGSAASFEPGLCVQVSGSNYVPLATAGSVAGILLSTVTDLADSTNIKAVILKDGPALINGDQIDYNSVTPTATVDSTLDGLGIKQYSEPTVSTTLAS